jgi:hypothetical protein
MIRGFDCDSIARTLNQGRYPFALAQEGGISTSACPLASALAIGQDSASAWIGEATAAML